MLQRFTKVSKVCLLAAAVLSLAAGPSAAVAEARYEFRAWIAKVEAGRKSKPTLNSDSPANGQNPNQGNDETPRGSERGFNCFYVPTSAKPSDTKVSGDLPLFTASPQPLFDQQRPALFICTAPLSAPSPIHQPAHRAQAPPRA